MIIEGINNGKIQHNDSPWASPVIFTRKKDSHLWQWCGCQLLNSLNVKYKGALPLRIGWSNSLIYAKKGHQSWNLGAYGHLWVSEGNEDNLVSVFQATKFSLQKMLYRPRVARGNFQYFIHNMLLSIIGKETSVHLDEIMAYTKKGVDHK